jgi:hypothetical protein
LRRGELAQVERARDVRADRIVVRPEHAKTGAQHEVPLTALMRQVIAGSQISTSPLVFPSSKTGGRLKGWTKLVAKLQQVSGVDFRLHDLRGTARTLMSRLGVAEDLAELAIGHVRADLVARYNKDTAWDGRRDAFMRVSDHVETLIGARAATTSTQDSGLYGFILPLFKQKTGIEISGRASASTSRRRLGRGTNRSGRAWVPRST